MSITLIIIIVTSLISFLCFNDKNLFDKLKHYPVAEKKYKEYYRWLTSGFLHGDIMHLAINMFVLYSFGTQVENEFIFQFGRMGGSILFIGTYLLVIIMADITSYYKHINNPTYSSIGASGGVSGILFIFILMRPWSMLGLYGIIPVPAIIFGILYLWYESWADKNKQDNIGHDAHFFGAIAGILIAVISRPAIIIEFFHSLTNDFPF
ncbi:MAG: rhomboid family intramembrane serine protease [Saprospiraceae bacterium]|nr:rhomboid family intramembrane serine protease [Saprospiraceae bacterium]